MMKAALIGYGYWGKIIRTYIDADAHFELVKICSEFLSEETDDLYTDDITDILNDKEIETVFICTPVHTHYSLCQIMLMSGKHVFCEKPTVSYSDDLDHLFQIADMNYKILFTDYIYTASKSIQMMKELLGKIGKVYFIKGEISQFGKFYKNESVYDVIGVHLLSVLAYLLPEVSVQSCQRLDAQGIEKFHSNVVLRMDNDIDVFFSFNLLDLEKRRTFSIYGTNGCISFDMMDPLATLRYCGYTKDETETFVKKQVKEWKYDENNNLKNVLEMFYHAVTVHQNDENVYITKKVNELLEIIKGEG